MKLVKCENCGAMVKVFKPCQCEDCGIMCCGKQMNEVKANSVDAAFEKHIPNYEIVDNKVVVRVNHVMDEEHYIEWIAGSFNNVEQVVYLKPGKPAQAQFDYVSGMKLYAYCNKHGLWENIVH